MFTGLVEAMGFLRARRPAGPGAVLELACPLGPLQIGESVSVEGACLTVKRLTASRGGQGRGTAADVPTGFEADVSAETLERTTLGALAVGAKVNLERSLPLGARMGGHLVTGHVDATCTLTTSRPVGDATAMTFAVPAALARLIAEKGSVAINGVSLTVNAVRDTSPPELDVVIVPHTHEVTSLGDVAVGGRANLEVDLLARYVARILGAPRAETTSSDAAWMARLTKGGYL